LAAAWAVLGEAMNAVQPAEAAIVLLDGRLAETSCRGPPAVATISEAFVAP